MPGCIMYRHQATKFFCLFSFFDTMYTHVYMYKNSEMSFIDYTKMILCLCFDG